MKTLNDVEKLQFKNKKKKLNYRNNMYHNS